MKKRQTCEIEHRRNRGLNKMDFGSTSKISFCALNRRKVAIVPFFVVLLLSVVRGDASSDKGKGVSQSDDQTKCTNCPTFRAGTKTAAIEHIKGKILNAMGFVTVPEYPKVIFPPLNQILNLYNTPEVTHTTRHKNSNGVLTEELDEDEHVKVQSEMYQGAACTSCSKYKGQTPVIFTFDTSTMKITYETIELMLYFNNSQFCSENVSVDVYKLIQRQGDSEKYIQTKTTQVNLQQFFSFNRRHDSHEMKEHYFRHKQKMESSWISIDYKDVIMNHLKETTSANNLTLVITARYTKSSTPDCPDLTKNSSLHPVLRFEYEEKTNKRTKRTVKQDCKENSNTTDCCRYPLTIDFDDFKWDFIIAPRSYEAFYCAGQCPYLWKQTDPHAHIVQMANPKAGGPCCSPKKMNAIDMLYFTSKGTILFGKIGGMVVEKCGCS